MSLEQNANMPNHNNAYLSLATSVQKIGDGFPVYLVLGIIIIEEFVDVEEVFCQVILFNHPENCFSMILRSFLKAPVRFIKYSK